MADRLPFEDQTPETRRADRESAKLALAGVDRSIKSKCFLAEMAEAVLNLQALLEDTTIVTSQIPVAAAAEPNRNASVAALRTASTTAAEIAGKISMAAQYDCAAVAETVSAGAKIPGLSAAQVKAIKANYVKRKEPTKKKGKSATATRLDLLQRQLEATNQAMMVVLLVLVVWSFLPVSSFGVIFILSSPI